MQSNDLIHLRWFTPRAEVELCGHATLGAAHVLFQHLGYTKPSITFSTKSGYLEVAKTDNGLSMDFPASMPEQTAVPTLLLEGLGIEPIEVLAAEDYFVVLNCEHDVKDVRPDFAKAKWLIT